MHDLADKKYVKLPPQTTLYQHFLPFFESIRSSASADSAGSGEGGLVDIIADGRLETIVRIVENVSWTTEKRLRAQAGGLTPWYLSCKELHCVQDADRLDAIGAFGEFPKGLQHVATHQGLIKSPYVHQGIMRCAAYSAIVNRPLYVPADENEGDPNASAIGHFHDKLLLIRERLKTDAGRDMGEKRHKLVSECDPIYQIPRWTRGEHSVHGEQMLDFLRGIDDEYDCLV